MDTWTLRRTQPADHDWIEAFVAEQWGAPISISRGHVCRPAALPGFAAEAPGGELLGLVTYRIDAADCEIVTLNSLRSGAGIGSALIDAVRGEAWAHGCRRLWLITTNDNLHALGFYQKRGFVLAALRPNALAESRRIKPSIPLVGMDGIPLRDEIELEMRLDDGGG